MKTILCSIVIGAVALTGCASVPPPAVPGVSVVPVSSSLVGVLPPRLITKDGQLTLQGSVFKKVSGGTTVRTHLDVVFLDADKRPLAEDTATFAPRELHRGHRGFGGRGHYSLPIPALPNGTAIIEVRAHIGEHGNHG